jgi:hypothetical protein
VDAGSELIEDSEFLYRRVPASTGWYHQATGVLKAEAFGPHRTQDITGLSVARAKYKSLEEAARGRPGKSYLVAVLRAGDLRQRGIEVVPRPELPDGHHDPAHAELPDLNSETRKANQTLEWQRLLAEELTLRVEGPFAMSPGESA